jgi:multidrug efflux pump subunit AcrB
MKGFNLSEWAINHRPFVWFLMILFVAAGVRSYKQLDARRTRLFRSRR